MELLWPLIQTSYILTDITGGNSDGNSTFGVSTKFVAVSENEDLILQASMNVNQNDN